MQNTIQKFRQSSIVFEEPGILSENLKTLTSSNYHTVQYLSMNLRTGFLLINVYKRVCGIFLFYLDLELFAKIKKRPGFYTLAFYTVINNSRSNQNKKNPTYLFVDITKTCAKFLQKILNSMVVGARKNFQFFKQKNWFLGNNRGLP